MELGKPSALSIGAWVALIAICVYLIFLATHKTDNDTEMYTGKAAHNEYTTNISPTQNVNPFGFTGCSPFVRLDNPIGKGAMLPVSEVKVKK